MNKKIYKFIQVVVTAGLLSFVFYQAGLFSVQGRATFFASLNDADMGILLISIMVGVLANLCSAFKWFMLTQSQQLGASYWRIFSYYLVGQFYNLFLPTSVGGDVVRSYELGKYSGRQADSLASVFVERYTGVLMLLVLSVLAVLSQLSRLNAGFVILSLFAFAIGLGLIAWMLFDARPYVWLKGLMIERVPLTEKLFAKVDKLLASIGHYRGQSVAVLWAFANSLLFYMIAVLNVWVTALVFDVDVQWVHMLVATPIIMLVMNIPLSFGNLGLMEFAYSSLFQLMGYSPTLGLSVALLMRFKSLLDGAMGGVLQPIFVTQKRE